MNPLSLVQLPTQVAKKDQQHRSSTADTRTLISAPRQPLVQSKREHDGVKTNQSPARKKSCHGNGRVPLPAPKPRTNYYTKDVTSPSFAAVVSHKETPTTTTAPNAAVNQLGHERGAEVMHERVHGQGVANKVHVETVPMETERATSPDDMIIDDIDDHVSEDPARSWVVREPKCTLNLNTRSGRKAFNDTLPTAVQNQLNEDFGKDDNEHSFTNEATFRHILLPLFFSEYLDNDEWQHLRHAAPVVNRLGTLIDEMATVDFRPLREKFFPDNWDKATDFNHDRTRMLTACLLFYKGSVADVVRFVGGPFIGAHRDVKKILNTIRGHVPQHIYNEIERIYTKGAPTVCNASSTDENLKTYLAYGNHSSAEQDEEVIRKAMLKDEKRGHVMRLDGRFKEFALHMHICPVALADLDHPLKKPRFIYDASFHPTPPSLTCNDWTTKETEPELEFPKAFHFLLVWYWNMRITYPDDELYPLDDDVVAAFRTLCWHPNLVSMHGLYVLDHLWFMVRLTFGDCTSPPNFEPVAIARRYMAQYYYNLPNVEELAAAHMPDLQIVVPSAAELASIMRIPPDSKNKGMQGWKHFDPNYDPDTPPYVHHVDDNLYGSLMRNLRRAIAASILGLFAVVGEPVAIQPHPFSFEKFELLCNHLRKITGVMINTRTMMLWYPDYKRKQIVDLLAKWLTKRTFTIKEGLELQGVLMDASRFYIWGRVRFFILQGIISNCLRQRYHVALRYRKIHEDQAKKEMAKYKLSNADEKRFARVRMNELQTRYLYKHGHATPVSKRLLAELADLHAYLADFSNPWQINIGHIIDRDSVSDNVGDSSWAGVGFWSTAFEVICSLPTNDSIRRRCNQVSSGSDAYLSQNIMEFITAVLDYACSVTILEHDSCVELRARLFPNGVPPMPCVTSVKDNRASESWIKNGACGSFQGQQLIRILAAIGKPSNVKQNGGRITGSDNDKADKLSRPDEPNGYRTDRDSLIKHFESVLVKYPEFADYKVFVPSSNLLDVIAWALRPKSQAERTAIHPPPLVQPYGRFVTPDEYKVNMTFLYDD